MSRLCLLAWRSGWRASPWKYLGQSNLISVTAFPVSKVACRDLSASGRGRVITLNFARSDGVFVGIDIARSLSNDFRAVKKAV